MKSKKQARIWARLCALALIAVMLLTSAYAGSAVESGLAVDSLATENLTTENPATENPTAENPATENPTAENPTAQNLAQQNTVPAEGTAAALAPASTNATEASTAVEGTAGSHKDTAATIPYRAPQGGAVALAEDDPTYILVLGSDQINVTAFYPATTDANGNLPSSTNAQWGIIGLYYDMNHRAHILLAHNMNNAQFDKLGDFHLNSDTFQKGNYSYQLELASLTKVVLKDEQGNQLESLTPKLSGKTPQGYFDIEVGDIEIGKNFTVSMDGNPGGWQIDSIQVDLDLDYTLTKTVAKGNSAAEGVAFTESVFVERGDWVIYKITVANTGKLPLQNMILTDLLPQDVFVEGSVQMGVGEEDGSMPDWTLFNGVTLFHQYNSPGEFTRDIYIKAQIKPDLDIQDATSYDNTATLDGMDMPTLEDTATITVEPPTPGTLRVSKTVTLENPLDAVPNDTFNFTITYGNKTETFTLKNGGEHTISDFPAGTEFTVTEDVALGYTTRVNSAQGMSFTGTMQEGGSAVVTFENQLSATMVTLNICKKDQQNNAPLAGAQFELWPATVSGDGDWVKTESAAPITPTYAGGGDSTDENGLVAFPVQLGNYLLYEVKAPSGYKLLTDPVRLTVTNDKVILYLANGEKQEYAISNLDVTVSLSNIKQDKLPVTGGMGAIWFTGGGLALAGAAALLYFKQRRKKGEE